MVKVGLIVPNNSTVFLRMARRIAESMNIDLTIGHGHFAQGLTSAQEMLRTHPNIEVFVSRCNTAMYLRNNIDLPVIDLTLTNFDFAKAISAWPDRKDPVLLIQFINGLTNYDIEAITQICGVEMKTVFVDMEQPNDYNLVAEQMQCRRVVTSIAVVAEACQRGGKEVMIVPFPEEVIRHAFEQAVTLAHVRESDRRRIHRFKETLDSFQEAFIATDEAGEISIFNRAFAEIMGISAQSLIGKNIEQAKALYPFLCDVFSAEDEGIVEYRGEKYSVTQADTIAPGLVDNLRQVTSVPELQRKESTVRRKLLERSGFQAKNTFEHIISVCPAMAELKMRARHYARTPSNILILGESGTGKELFAQGIHNESNFSKGPFVAINCAALPETLLESELFGYEEGAFTGARRGGKAGLMEMSYEGTLFLDEIGLMPKALQAKILRSIQERQICRLGGNRLIPIRSRMICATNRDLVNDVRQGLFREDLYYRIDVLSLKIPPLRERKEDIIHLARLLFSAKCCEMGRSIEVSEESLRILQEYDWPGNVRQLETFLERLAVLTEGDHVEETLLRSILAELPSGVLHERMERDARTQDADVPSRDGCPHEEEYLVKASSMEKMEEQIIREAFRRCHGDITELRQMLGISRTTLWRKLKLYSLGEMVGDVE